MNNNKNDDWQLDSIKLAQTGVMSWRAIAKVVGVSKSTVSDYLRKYSEFRGEGDNKEWPQCESHATFLDEDNDIKLYGGSAGSGMSFVPEDKHDNSRILVISDLHAPYNNPHAIEFLAGLKEKYVPTRVISVGDEVDKMAMSYHESNPDLPSAGHELIEAQKVIKELHKLFPEMDILESNHGSLHLRKAMTAGIPRAYIKNYNDILGVGDGWQWYDDLIVTLPNGQPCYFTHGKAVDGLKLSQNYSMNCVQGHHHSEFNVKYWSNPLNLFWSMQVGCLVDNKSLAMAYNRLQLKRPIIGCGLIIDSKPVLEAMDL